MKSIEFLATFLLILFVKIIRGQHDGLHQNIETNSNLPQQQPTNTLVNSIQRYLNQRGNAGALSSKIDHNQVQIQKKIIPALSSSQPIQQLPDIDQQSLRLKQLLQQKQPIQSLQMTEPLQTQQPVQQPQILQSQLPPQEIQQPHILQQSSQQVAPSLQQKVDFLQPSSFQQQNCNVNSNLQLQPFNLQYSLNVEPTLSSQNLVVQPPSNLKHDIEVINTPQQFGLSPQEVSSTVYSSPEQSPNILTAQTPVSSHDPSIAIIPGYNIKSTEQSKVPSYSYAQPRNDVQGIVDRTQAISSIPALSSVLIPPVQTANVQTYYYNLPDANPRQNVYINQNSQFQYQQPKVQIAPVQTQSAAVIPSQSSILSSLPLPVVQTQFPQYGGILSSYPINAIVAPAYTSNKLKTSNLKSLLPIIFNLLREKIGSCSCQNSCPCDCQNKSICNELEVSSGYSSLKNYGALKEDAFSVINTTPEECDSRGCLRERKNLKTEKVVSEVSEESDQEDDESEEEVDDVEEEED